jgi:hypothetical protein
MIIVFKNPPFCKEIPTFSQNFKKLVYLFAYFKKKQYLWAIFRIGSLCPYENTLITRINLDTMNLFVRTNHTTHSLLLFSKMVAVLLLIFFPVLASANPIYQSSSNRYAAPSTVGAQSMQYQPESYQMTNMPNYQMSTTYSPAQTLYTPFSNENPGNSGNGNAPSRIGGRKNDVGTGGFDTDKDPNASNEYPLGDAWSLLIFAAMTAVVITLRKKQTA